MTNDLIYGLNCFSPKVVFLTSKDSLFCDRGVDTQHDLIFRTEKLPIELKPAALHCHYASIKQAFHYGVHRTLKKQFDIIEKVKSSWLKEKDDIRAFALIGSRLSNKLCNQYNYGDYEFENMFEYVKQLYSLNKRVELLN